MTASSAGRSEGAASSESRKMSMCFGIGTSLAACGTKKYWSKNGGQIIMGEAPVEGVGASCAALRNKNKMNLSNDDQIMVEEILVKTVVK